MGDPKRLRAVKRTVVSLGMVALVGLVLVIGNYYSDTFLARQKKKEKYLNQAEQICKVDQTDLKDKGLELFTSNLPVLMVDTNGKQIYKETAVWGKVGIWDEPDADNDVRKEPETKLFCTIKHRGASSYSQFDKSQYRLTLFKKKEGKKLAYPLAGMTADSEWVLYGPYLDKSFLRNDLIYRMGQDLQVWSPDTRFVELFLDGKYQGLYLCVEAIEETEGRLNLSDYGLAFGQTAYILERNRIGTEEHVINTWGTLHGKTSYELSISYPNTDEVTKRQAQWITDDISRFEENLYSQYFADPQIGYAKYIEVDSFVDYYLLNEVVLNHDAGELSTYIYKDLNGKLKMAIWDYNNAYDNYQWFSMDPEEFHLNEGTPWFSRLLEDRAFVDRLVARYKELRKTTMSTTFLYGYLNQENEKIQAAAARDQKVWGYAMGMKLLTNKGHGERNVFSQEAALQQLKDIIDRRFQYMDAHMDVLYANCFN